jgi:hypothetical protein
MLKTKEARKKAEVIGHFFVVSVGGFVRGITFP